MAEVRRDSFTQGLKADMYAYGFKAYDSLEPVHEQIFEVVGSSKAYEQSTSLVDVGELVEKKGSEAIVFESALEGYTVYSKNRTFGKGIEFEMELVEDLNKDTIRNIVTQYAARWGERAIQKKEQYAANMFNYGGYTAGHDVFSAHITNVTPGSAPTGLLYDGKPLFNLTGNGRGLYPGDGITSYYNGLALPFSADNMQTLELLMSSTNNVDSVGSKIALRPEVILFPSALKYEVRKALVTTGELGTANNDRNMSAGMLRPIEWQYLTNSSAWFMGIPGKGLKLHNRKPLTFDFWQDHDTGAYKAKVVMRFGVQANDWRYWHGSNFATSA